MNPEPDEPDPAPTARSERKRRIRAQADAQAGARRDWLRRARTFHQRDRSYLKRIIPEGARVLDLGCGTGDVLAELRPNLGIGIDFSDNMIALARSYHPELRFIAGDIEQPETFASLDGEAFDYIILCDTIGSLDDVQATFESLHRLCRRETRIVVSYYSHLWEPLLKLAEIVGRKMPQEAQNFLRMRDIANFLEVVDLDVVRQERRLLMPYRLLGLGTVIDRCLASMPLLRRLCLRHYTVARSLRAAPYDAVTATVVIPCRNERGNIAAAIRRMPRFTPDQEVIFVEGHSEDGTFDEILRVIRDYDGDLDLKAIRQPGIGKADAVRAGFDLARGEMLAILDADLTVAPEDLAKFHDAMVSGKGEFINGSRLVYPAEDQAMRLLNLIANHVFATLFSWLLGQKITDTLCGTKVIMKARYREIEAERGRWGVDDPFGDFDLILGAARHNLKILELPVRYYSRFYGETQIDRFRHGWILLRLFVSALAKNVNH